MRAAWCERLGPPSAVVVAERPDPQAGPRDVLVGVRAAAVNYPDVLIVAGSYQVRPPLPFTPGSEFAGEVLAVGSGVTTVAVSDKVIGATFTGAFAQKAAVPCDAVYPLPASLDEAALRATRWGGRFVTVGFASGHIPLIPLNLVLLKGVQIRGFEIRTLADHMPDAVKAAEPALAKLVGEGLRPHVSAVYPLADVARALEDVAQRRTTGKVVLDLAGA